MRGGRVVGRGAVALFVFLCTVEAMYWPLLPKPGSIRWWHVRWLAGVGYYVGSPAMFLAAAAGSVGAQAGVADAVGWLSGAMWALLIYSALGRLSRDSGARTQAR